MPAPGLCPQALPVAGRYQHADSRHQEAEQQQRPDRQCGYGRGPTRGGRRRTDRIFTNNNRAIPGVHPGQGAGIGRTGRQEGPATTTHATGRSIAATAAAGITAAAATDYETGAIAATAKAADTKPDISARAAVDESVTTGARCPAVGAIG